VEQYGKKKKFTTDAQRTYFFFRNLGEEQESEDLAISWRLD
jgi:hypothetical protein